MRGPALGVLEVATIARGIVVADAALKRAQSVLLYSRAVSGGKHLVILDGEVADVEESMIAGRAAAGDKLLHSIELPYADSQVWLMLDAPTDAPPDWSADAAAEAVVIVETATVCAAIAAADAAAKIADIVIRDVRLAVDIAGKAYFTMTGSLDAAMAAAAAASAAADRHVVAIELIANPSPDLRGRLFR